MGPALGQAPVAFSGLVAAADLPGRRHGRGGRHRPTDPTCSPWPVGGYRPTQVLAWGEPYPSPLWEGRQGPAEDGLAFVCRHYTCDAPVADAATLEQRLSA